LYWFLGKIASKHWSDIIQIIFKIELSNNNSKKIKIYGFIPIEMNQLYFEEPVRRYQIP
jgi:hypothetical protein